MGTESGDVGRNITQLLLDQGIFTEQALLERFALCVGTHKADAKRAKLRYHPVDQQSDDAERNAERNLKALQGVIEHSNEQLKTLGLMVARMKSKASGVQETYYGLVDLNSHDEFSKLATTLNKGEQEYFRRVVAEILASDDKEIFSTDAKNLGRELEVAKLNADQAESCLEQLERGSWLTKVVDDDEVRYTLGVRTELQQRYAPTGPDPAQQQETAELDD